MSPTLKNKTIDSDHIILTLDGFVISVKIIDSKY